MNRKRISLAAGVLVSLFTLHATPVAFAQCVPDTLLQTIPNPEPADLDAFGVSVAISGNVIVVGAVFDDPGGVPVNAGSAHVFNATTGALVATLNNPVPATNDHFGRSVAISGNRAVVGAPSDGPSGGSTSAGKAYVFNATTGALSATLNNPSPTLDDKFGDSVAISGNLAVVAATLDDPGGVNNAGTAYVFNATTGALVATLNNPSPTAIDRFGTVAISGNIVVVGAPFDDPGEVGDAGTVYVFNATTGALTATLNNPSPTALDWFGESVAVSGNVVVVGAGYDDPDGVAQAGIAYVFDLQTGNPPTATLNNPTPEAGDRFGASVAISSTLVVVAAINDDPDGVGTAGSAYVFDATTGALMATLNNPVPEANDQFGNSVALDGIVAAVGAYLDDPGGVPDAGSAYTFTCTTPTPTPSPTPSPTASPSPSVSPSPSPSPTPFNDADFISHTIPSAMAPGQGLWVGVTMRNTGNTAWIPGANHALGVFGADECGLFAQPRFGPAEAVLPGENHQFMVRVTTPMTPGGCSFTLRMIEEFVEWFGEPLSMTVNVVEEPNAAVDWAIYQ